MSGPLQRTRGLDRDTRAHIARSGAILPERGPRRTRVRGTPDITRPQIPVRGYRVPKSRSEGIPERRLGGVYRGGSKAPALRFLSSPLSGLASAGVRWLGGPAARASARGGLGLGARASHLARFAVGQAREGGPSVVLTRASAARPVGTEGAPRAGNGGTLLSWSERQRIEPMSPRPQWSRTAPESGR